MPFTDADGNPITCFSCPFKINTDCTAMPPTPSTNALTMQVWNYPPARNPCVRHPALGGMKLPEGVTAVLDVPAASEPITELLYEGMDGQTYSTATTPQPKAEVVAVPDPELDPPISDDSPVPVPSANDPGIVGNAADKPPTRTRASRATARPAE